MNPKIIQITNKSLKTLRERKKELETQKNKNESLLEEFDSVALENTGLNKLNEGYLKEKQEMEEIENLLKKFKEFCKKITNPPNSHRCKTIEKT